MSAQPPFQYFKGVPDASAPPSSPSSKQYTLTYTTHGSPVHAPHRTVVLPTCYGGRIATTTPFLYQPFPDCGVPVFDTQECFVVVIGLLGGGESSSPSIGFDPQKHSLRVEAPDQAVDVPEGAAEGVNEGQGKEFPETSYEDNVRLQYQLLRKLGVEKVWAYVGFSMGGQQAYHISVLYPLFIQNMVCLAGSARTSMHNWSFLEGPKAALLASADYHSGHYASPARKGTSAFGRVYSTWALSQEWFRQECWRLAGFETLEAYLVSNWDGEAGLGGWDANDLLCLLRTWQRGDVTRCGGDAGLVNGQTNGGSVGGVGAGGKEGDLATTLRRVKARCLIMPSKTDMYFPPEDNEEEVRWLRHGKCVVIKSVWGHLAGGGGGTKEDNAFINDTIRDWIAEPEG